LLSPDQLGQKYDLNINLMSYNSLIKAIPNTWKHLMLNRPICNKLRDSETCIIVNNARVCMDMVKSHMLYRHFVHALIKPPASIDKWGSEFVFLNDEDFANFFELPYKVLRDTKMQTFQTSGYKIILESGFSMDC
jgi:hypothetical protein